MTCEHDEYEMLGNFPENMEVEDEFWMNKIQCLECGKIGKEYYQFIERRFEN